MTDIYFVPPRGELACWCKLATAVNIYYIRTELEKKAGGSSHHQDHSCAHFHTFDMPSNLHYLTVNDNKQRVREKLGLKGEEKDGVWRIFEVRDCIAFK